MKKFFAIFIFTMTLMFAKNNFVEASNHYVGIYPESGLKAYLMTETIQVGYLGRDFRCSVVCYPSGRPYYIDYRFIVKYDGVYFVNSDGFVQKVGSHYTPVENNIVKYVILYY